jgi:cytochrome c-type biogenesis protein CcmF
MPGKLGHFFVILAFVMSLFSMFSYWRAASTENSNPSDSRIWHLIGRNTFVLHAFSVFTVFFTLFYIIQHHLFEYHYAWRHSDLSLSPKYLLSCFWEGQEGSFLLWTIWHCVLGLIVMFTSKGLESRVMSIISLVQVALTSMILGFYLGPDIKIGSDPFILLRTQMQNAPIFAQANYLDFIKDGNGLNVLLQNYWMVIHPPILFLGFASTLIPFAYTIATLWKRDYTAWIKPTVIWSLFSGGILGLGIMMGGAWAYESLTFGGYWAWDPVENASLVPWLILVAGLHTLIVFKATGRSFIITAILLMLSQLLVWYSTFLTRTGILGDTSVHAFTDEGKALYWHILIVIGVMLLLSLWQFISRWKSFPRIKSEETINSREFWMFIGSFILALSATQIILTTSIPVWAPLAKYITGKEVAPPASIVQHYNNIQVWVAIIVLMLTATILYLRFKTSDTKMVLKRLGITFVLSLIMAVAIGMLQHISTPQYCIMLFAACYTIVGMIYYMIVVQKLVFKKMGAATAHFGFGLLMLGILISSYNKHAISINTTGERIGVFNEKDRDADIKENMEHVFMFKNIPVAMRDYTVTYKGDSTSTGDIRTFYKVQYDHIDTTTQQLIESFTLYPEIIYNKQGGANANPSSRHYLSHDVFTYLTPLNKPKTDTAQFRRHKVKEDDTIFTPTHYIIFKGLNTDIPQGRYQAQANDVAVAATLDVYSTQGKTATLKPLYYIRDQYAYQVVDSLKDIDLYAKLENILPDTKQVEILVKQANPKDDAIVIKTLVFPYINLVWLGVMVTVFGFFLTAVNRITKKEGKKKEAYPFTK